MAYCMVMTMQVMHLGNVIDYDLSDVADSNSKKGHFIASVN